MDLTFSEEETQFRDELRAWLAANHPGEEPRGDEDKEFEWRRDWQRRLNEGGWAGVHWPTE
ncbi:MAG: acyl-CoA dehydrogenase family protein, partial [Actinomycetes bacterium]